MHTAPQCIGSVTRAHPCEIDPRGRALRPPRKKKEQRGVPEGEVRYNKFEDADSPNHERVVFAGQGGEQLCAGVPLRERGHLKNAENEVGQEILIISVKNSRTRKIKATSDESAHMADLLRNIWAVAMRGNAKPQGNCLRP